ncbi:MAG: sugar ABC transporter ATP-binding protein [Chloroflexota bacterium]|nr:MAG: D-xylose ABC transporter ATP-binding protein [Chloroflexota bacterium]
MAAVPVPVLELKSISKTFAGIRALDAVSLDVSSGEVHALLGENGAGKSTLVRVITGVHTPDSGTIRVGGETVTMRSPADAHGLGISAIYQEPTLFPDLDVAENIYMGNQPVSAGSPHINWRSMYRDARELLDRLGVRLDARARVRGLSVADQQTVEIAKALSTDSRVLLMDEPTASLSQREVDELFRIVRQLSARGVGIVFISHRLEEVYEIADRITVLRDGKNAGAGHPSDLPQDDLIRMMVGRTLDKLFPKQDAEIGDVVLKVEKLSRRGVFRDISFELRRGEILGLAGLVGAGRSEVARAIFGIDSLDSGVIRVDGKPVTVRAPGDALRQGITYVPEDRQHQGLVLSMSISHNITLPLLRLLSTGGWISKRREQRVAREQSERLQVRGAASLSQAVRQLSGGNQQKVVLAKWLATKPRIIILDEPTRGIDVGTKAEVHRLISELAGQGMAILMISSELPEILGMSDRIIVMHEGRLTAECMRAAASQEKIMMAATGRKTGSITEGAHGTAPDLARASSVPASAPPDGDPEGFPL